MSGRSTVYDLRSVCHRVARLRDRLDLELLTLDDMKIEMELLHNYMEALIHGHEATYPPYLEAPRSDEEEGVGASDFDGSPF